MERIEESSRKTEGAEGTDEGELGKGLKQESGGVGDSVWK